MGLRKQLNTTSKYEQILNSEGVFTLQDFFKIFPRTYENRDDIKTLSDLDLDQKEKQTVKGKILDKNYINTSKGKLLKIKFQDTNGKQGSINYMNMYYKAKKINKDKRYLIIGKPKANRGEVSFWYPDVIPASNEAKKKNLGIHPVYAELQGIKPAWFAKKIYKRLDQIPDLFKEKYPKDFLKKFNLLGIHKTIKNIHFPSNMELLEKAKNRIYFEKLLKVQLLSQIKKKDYHSYSNISDQNNKPDRDIIKDFLSYLPFELTHDQKKAIRDAVQDFHSNKPMLRLLQGDVGSGKTVVAIACMFYIIKKKDKQCAFLAPTEVLAQQHYKNIVQLLDQTDIQVKLLTGSTRGKAKKKIKSKLAHGNLKIVVGTHAIIQKDVDFSDLELAIIDEQHKFGVNQRGFFKKFNSPHILQMTATPIPRSLALTYFGEFDISNIKEMPKGRKDIHTKIIDQQELNKLKDWFDTKLNQGQKIYIVTPLIEESEKLENVQSVKQEYQDIQNFFSDRQDEIGILHGDLPDKEKNKVMKKFKNGNTNILVSTTVIEVGVDVPEATIMIIKNSERFGLSQLHQLRGRVGRSELQSYCFLMTDSKGGDTYDRLKAMEEYNDGFKLSKIDLNNRGSGEFLGTRQSGFNDIPLKVISDQDFVKKAKQAAKRLIENYPNLEQLEELKKEILNDKKEVIV